MVDNLVHSFGLQIDNGIPILEFIDNQKDEELKFVESILMDLKDVDDVRPYLDKRLQLKRLVNLSDKDMDIWIILLLLQFVGNPISFVYFITRLVRSMTST